MQLKKNKMHIAVTFKLKHNIFLINDTKYNKYQLNYMLVTWTLLKMFYINYTTPLCTAL